MRYVYVDLAFGMYMISGLTENLMTIAEMPENYHG